MYLHSLSIENFRGIRNARLDFDETTVIIGENDSGKSSLLEALAMALLPSGDGAPMFEPQHFHRESIAPSARPVGPVRLKLTFQERQAGEWDAAGFASLAGVLGKAAGKPRQLLLRVTAAPSSVEQIIAGSWEMASTGAGGAPSQNDTAALATLRALNPLVWLRGGALVGAGPAAGPVPRPEAQAPADIAHLVEEIEQRYQAVISGDTRHAHDELRAGYESARELLALRAIETRTSRGLGQPLLAEVLGAPGSTESRRVRAMHGSAAQQLGVFILTAALLRHHPGATAPGAQPLLVIEDPEAHLHLMTLASVWGLLEHIQAQKIISTHSGTLLAAAPLHTVRRLTRHQGEVRQWSVPRDRFKTDDLRKLSYHLRARRGVASFARCWLLVEGETEFWILPELARMHGYDFSLEGVAVVEFAQCGLAPLVGLARELGIQWHVLTDGDRAGSHYADTAASFMAGDQRRLRLTRLRDVDIEHCFWHHGYAAMLKQAAGLPGGAPVLARQAINRAIKRLSKPYLAFELLIAVTQPGSAGVPKPLRQVIDTCVQLARGAPQYCHSGHVDEQL
jgi:putative ATP-dependent endonuclease of OLD family